MPIVAALAALLIGSVGIGGYAQACKGRTGLGFRRGRTRLSTNDNVDIEAAAQNLIERFAANMVTGRCGGHNLQSYNV